MTQPAEPVRPADAITVAAILLLGVLLFAVGSGILGQWQLSSARQQGLSPEHLLGAAAAAGGAALVGWWLVAFVFAGATVFLERNGRTRAAAATRNLSPALMRRLVLAALSVQLLSGPAAHAGAILPGPEWTPAQSRVASAPASAGPLAVEERPENPATQPLDIDPGWQPAAPVAGPGLLAAPAVRAVEQAGIETEAVAVLAGDTLWDIAAQAMGPGASDVEIAMEWPRWYEANRAVIGQNPDVLLPGQILQPPSAA
ncbi:LysM peptidoglycan-binding domain-containing protein [Arthrobacter sp. D3-16]